MTNFKRDEYKKCPVCKSNTFKYDPEIKANRCYNEFCGWTDQVLPAHDVPMSFLKSCFNRIEPGPKKDKLMKIIEETERVRDSMYIPSKR